MKVCNKCGEEIATKDGENLCAACEACEEQVADDKTVKRTTGLKRRERDALLRSLGLTKVRGAMGGTYWE